MSQTLRIMVTGASGFIGRAMLGMLSRHTVRGLCFAHPEPGLVSVDFRDRGALGAAVKGFGPDWVVHCAARPSVDWCEENPEAARALNLDPTVALVDECARLGAGLAFLSTDYVFDGESGPYGEADLARPINTYGRLKLSGEKVIRDRLDRHLIARTTNVYGYDPRSKNFLMAVLPRAARGETVAVAEDQFGTPTLVTDLCEALIALIEAGESGTFNVVGSEQADRLTWARAAALAFGIDPGRFVGRSTASLGQAASRPLRSGLRSDRLQGALGRPLHGVEDGLDRMRQDWGGAPPVAEW